MSEAAASIRVPSTLKCSRERSFVASAWARTAAKKASATREVSTRSRFLVKLVGCQTGSESGSPTEPAQKQVVFQLFAEAALRRDGVEVLDELGAQEIFGRDGLAAPLVVEPVKERTEILKGPVNHPADLPQGVIGRYAVLQRGKEDDRLLPLLVSPHAGLPAITPFAG